MNIESFSPFGNHELVGIVESSTPDDVRRAAERSRAAQVKWSQLPISERCDAVRSFVAVSRKRQDEIAHLSAFETGRPISSSLANVRLGLEYLEWYLDAAPRVLAPVVTRQDGFERHEVRREPWGVVAAIVPWNYPYLAIAWQCGQALLSGNSVLYKNSENNPMFGRLVESLFGESDLPPDVFQVLQGDGSVGQLMVEAGIDFVAFTGSTKAGMQVAQIATERMIPFALELGGSAPCIVFDDADVDATIDTLLWQRFGNAGQSCDATKRLIVQRSRIDEVLSKLIERARRIRMGDPLDAATEMGPLVNERQLLLIEDQVKDAVDRGARIELGGGRPSIAGSFYSPTILTNINHDMRVWNEETFGPVLPVVMFDEEPEAVELANQTVYGLGAWVMTQNPDRFDRVARQLKSGMVSCNNVGYWIPENPFGGFGQSGRGRLNGVYGFEEFTQIKVVSQPVW